MAGFADFYTGGGMAQSPMAFTLAGIDDNMGNIRTDSALTQSQNTMMYGRALQNLTNDYASKGTGRGGQAGVAADQLGQDKDYGQSMNVLMTDRALANQSRNKVLATYGVMF
jgi:hypothetical protein